MKEPSEIVEDTRDEMAEEAEEITSDIEETAKEPEVRKEESPKEEKKVKKHDEAKALVEKAKSIVKEAEEQMDACKLLLSDDLKAYDEAKRLLKEGGMDASEALLAKLGYEAHSDEPEEEEESVVFETKEDVEPIMLREVSSGRFTGFIYALFGGIATLLGLVYYATNELGMTLDITKVPSNEALQSIFGWFGTQIGRPDDVLNGSLVVGAIVLAVMALIYMIRVSLKGSKNLHFAVKQLEDAQNYTTHKGNCKEEMDKVDAHIHDAIETLKTYQVLFNEQKGKLERILHFEGGTEESNYHEKSLREMKDTQDLLDAIKSFMALPMSEEGKLSGKSTLFLHRAKQRMQKMIEKLY
ncbi:hypothetical protein [Sulfurovum sp.]|uniref:hypothetical protein n=1 Tax=Sulfurovum sp. TaxID=1969726 RepID=UPI0025FADD97|nr:hypothetical protein [Sulfurovum sp.]